MTSIKKEKNTKNKASKSQEEVKKAPLSSTTKGSEAGHHVFENLKKHFAPEKVDEFQKKWLALPENRKKYQKITDAPQVVAEEIIAMTNDLIQYIQGQEGGNSGLIKKVKSGFSSFFKNPAKFVQNKAEAGKEAITNVAASATENVKEAALNVKESAKDKMDRASKTVEKKVKKTAKKVTKKAKANVNTAVNAAKEKVKSQKK